MRTFYLRESQSAVIPLADTEATALQEAGRRLIGAAKPWGEEESETRRTVVRCEPTANGQWRVTVDNAVGLISLGRDTQLVVNPKIPVSHLLYLFGSSGRFPRLDAQSGVLSRADSLWQLVAEWFLSTAERAIRRDLRRDYEFLRDELTELRGTIDALPSASAYYAGRVGFVCDFDEFNVNIPLNRVLRAATEVIVQSPELLLTQRRRGRAIVARMEDVGPLRPTDLQIQIEPGTAHYADSLMLTRHILGSIGRTFEVGGLLARTFLIRTPEVVEDGIRQILVHGLPDIEVIKRGASPPPTSIILTPDLWFRAHKAVADVKYKLAREDWKRPDLYQAVAFATGFNVNRAAVIEFADGSGASIPAAQVGQVQVQHLMWTADDHESPQHVAAKFVDDARVWLQGGWN